MDPLHVRHMDIYAYLLMREKKTVELQRSVCHALVGITFDITHLKKKIEPLIMTLSRGHTGQIKRTVIMR